ncbi:MAG: hypothetical protein R2862_03860 [Thermoanaerobaculia bacterium]
MGGEDRSRRPHPGEMRPAPAPVRAAPASAEEVMRTCPVCGHELAERKCKLYCPRPGCGYFLSCADFY